MEIPTDADIEIYSTADLAQTLKLFGQYGTRFLTQMRFAGRTSVPALAAFLVEQVVIRFRD